jgi:FlaA1/EpsC-like NDP-sugar epimerase
MTVVDPALPTAPWKSSTDHPRESGLPDNVRLLDSRRGDIASQSANDDVARSEVLEVIEDTTSTTAGHETVGVRFLSRIRAWMLVPLVDFVLILTPLAWRPHQIHAVVMMAVLGTLLLAGGGRYRARLHLSVLDELPTILTRMLAATATVASLILYMHQRDAVLVFLETACHATALVVVGRVITTRLTAFARRRGIVRYHTVLIGGGPLAAELAKILDQHPMYGHKVVGFVDDGDDFPAEQYLPRLGRLADLDIVVATTGACTLLVADGTLEERALIDAVRTESCQRADLLVVPRMHHFHTQTGLADHIGSIPVMRIRQSWRAGAADQARLRHRGCAHGVHHLVAGAGCRRAGGPDRGWTRCHLPPSQGGPRRQALPTVEVPLHAARR